MRPLAWKNCVAAEKSYPNARKGFFECPFPTQLYSTPSSRFSTSLCSKLHHFHFLVFESITKHIQAPGKW
ncbi:hypothetical protein ACOSQ3_004708 [Xanthoceras sorbifolium]